MKPHASIGLLAAALSLVLFVPEISSAQTTQSSQAKQQSSSAAAEASEMVPAQAALVQTIDSKTVKPGDEIRAKLTSKVHLKNGNELPSGTELIGKVGTDDMQQNGQSKLALCIDHARLKDGKTVPVKATIVGIYAPGIAPATPYPVQPGDQVANDWTSSIHGVDQIGALSGVDMHSNLTSKNSGVLVSTKKDDFKLKQGTELALAIAPLQRGQSTSMR
jgi:plastocyanin